MNNSRKGDLSIDIFIDKKNLHEIKRYIKMNKEYYLKESINFDELLDYKFKFIEKTKNYQEMEKSISCTENIFINSDDRIFKNDYDGCRGCDCEICQEIIKRNVQLLIDLNLVEERDVNYE